MCLFPKTLGFFNWLASAPM